MKPLVLVVDDSLTVRMDLTEAFETAGVGVRPCATAAEARAAVQNEPIALIVLDVGLPDADGIDLLGELRASPRSAQVPVILLSTEADVRDRIRGLMTGADEFVGKPYDLHYLISRARELAKIDGEGKAQALVLVIDDSPTFRSALKDELDAAGYRVTTAASGEEGLRVAADQRPQAVIVDGVLPGMDGATVIRRIRLDAALRRTPCLLLTGEDDAAAELRALDAGADAFVSKTEATAVVLARLGAVLRSAHAADGGATSSLLGPKRILAVDDSPTDLHVLAEAMAGEGCDVILARSGEEALEMLAVQPVDCILLDLVMPGIGGQETCRRIKEAPGLREIPLILLATVDDREAMIAGLSAGADDYLSKSSDLEVLRARVRAQLRRRQFEEEQRHIRNQLTRAEMEAAEARAARELAETRARLVEKLEHKNRDLEAFSYTVSHDLRAPLRTIEGFTRALVEECENELGERGMGYARRVQAAARRMGELIDDLLELSRLGSEAIRIQPHTDLSAIATEIAENLRRNAPDRNVVFLIADGVRADVDPRMIRVVLENLMGNAWKFTARVPRAVIELGVRGSAVEDRVYFVADNGAGFDSRLAPKLFAPFQRMHSQSEFPGTGIGLAIVRTIIERHGGLVWAESEKGEGARFYWTIGAGGTAHVA